MADLASLMQQGPAGAFMAGQNNVAGLAQTNAETERLKQLIQEIQIKNQQSQVMNPLLAQHQSLQNQGLEAGLPGIAADSRLKGTNADKAAGTLQSDIAAGNSKNETEMSQNKVKQLIAQGQTLYAAGVAGSQAGPTGAMVTQQKLREANVPQNSNFYQMSPQQLMDYGQKIVSNTEQFWQHKYGADKQAESHIEGIKQQGRNSLALENQQYLHGKYNKKDTAVNVEQMLLKSRNAAQSAEILDQAANLADAAGDDEAAAKYTARAKAARQRAAEDANNRAIGQPGVDSANVSGLKPKDRATADAPSGVGSATAPQVAPPGKVRVKNPNGTYGFIPAAQLEEAIKAGYTKAQ